MVKVGDINLLSPIHPIPYQPTPWGQSTKTYGRDKKGDIEIPIRPEDMNVARPDDSVGGTPRLDVNKRLGISNRRA